MSWEAPPSARSVTFALISPCALIAVAVLVVLADAATPADRSAVRAPVRQP